MDDRERRIIPVEPMDRLTLLWFRRGGKVVLLVLLLALPLMACRQSIPVEEIQSPVPGLAETATVRAKLTATPPAPTLTNVADPEPAPLSPAYPMAPTPTPGIEVLISPQGTPTRLPQPYLIRVLDWKLVQTQSPALCADCGNGRAIFHAPRNMGIVLLRVFSHGENDAKLTIQTDLAYADPLSCELTAGETYCGAIFGQVIDGKVTITSGGEADPEREIHYYLTFQTWAAYQP